MPNNTGFGLIGKPANLRAAGNTRPYTQMELHILRALVLSCGNRPQFNRACWFFCEVVDRIPAEIRVHYIEKGIRVPADKKASLSENLVQRRLWGMTIAYEQNVDPIATDFSREGFPISFVEGRLFIQRWHRCQRANNRTLEELCALLGRRTTDIVSNCRVQTILETAATPDPLAREKELAAIVKTLAKLELGDEEVLATWQHFASLLGSGLSLSLRG